jgi:hypothetical protein
MKYLELFAVSEILTMIDEISELGAIEISEPIAMIYEISELDLWASVGYWPS